MIDQSAYNIKTINEHGSAKHLMHLVRREVFNLRTGKRLRVGFAIDRHHEVQEKQGSAGSKRVGGREKKHRKSEKTSFSLRSFRIEWLASAAVCQPVWA
jgi:hypothetical protein